MKHLAAAILLFGTALGWVSYPVDTAGTEPRGWWTALRSRGNTIHVGYAVRTSGNPLQTAIRYARSDDYGLTWTLETVDTCTNYGSGYALMGWWRGGLELESDGTPQMAYTVEASVGSFCMRAKRTGPGAWKLDTVEMRTSQPLVCHDADLELDRNDRAHVLYTHYGVMTRYAVEDDTGWFRYDIPLGAPYGIGLALDSNDSPHAVIGTLSDVHYARSTDNGGSWLTERIDSGWWHVDITLDWRERPQVAYTRLNTDIRFARRDGPNDWYTTAVDAGGPNCCRPAIYHEREDNNTYLAYYPYMSSPDLRFTWTGDEGATWRRDTLYNTGGVYSSCSYPAVYDDERAVLVAHQVPGYRLGITIEEYASVAERPVASPDAARIFPNPARGTATISGLDPAVTDVRLFDASGRMATCARATEGSARLDLAGLPEGVYLVREEGRAGTTKLVVRH